MSEPTAVFAVGEFAEAVEDRRRSEDRKSVVPALEFLSHPVLRFPKQEFNLRIESRYRTATMQIL